MGNTTTGCNTYCFLKVFSVMLVDCMHGTHQLGSFPAITILPNPRSLTYSSSLSSSLLPSEHDQLFYLVHERVQVTKGSLDPHLWAYHLRITLKHLSLTLQQQNVKNHPILHAFLQEVWILCIISCSCSVVGC